MSHRALSGPMFHGTVEGMKAGQRLLPGTKVGISVFAEMSDDGAHIGGQHVSDAVYSSTRENTAWEFADYAAHHNAEQTGVKGRPVVHEVRPSRDVAPGVHTHYEEYRSSSAKILQTHLAPPGGQPALAGVNWNEHRDHLGGDGEANYSETAPSNHYYRRHTATQEQDAALAKHRESHGVAVAQAAGQQTLFGMPAPDTTSTAHERAKHHVLRELVNSGRAPAHEVDHELANDEAMDSFNRRRGRRTNFARRDR